MTIIISSIAVALALFITYRFFKPYLKTSRSMQSLIKGIAILFIITLFIAIGIDHFMMPDEPSSFKTTVELLKKDKNILSKIGSYKSHSWKEGDLPKDTDNPAQFRVAINGTDAKIYLTCEAKKDSQGNWTLMNIQQDSLIKH